MDVRRRARDQKPISQILVELGLVTPESLEKMRAAGHSEDRDLVSALAAKGLIDGDDVARAVATRHNLPYSDLDGVSIQPNVRAIIDRKFQLASEVVPLEVNDLALTVCVADPTNVGLKMQLESMTGKMVKFVVSSPERVRAAIRGKAHGVRGKEEDARGTELDLQAMWKLFDLQDNEKSAVVYGGKGRQLSTSECTIEGTLPTGDELRTLTFRKLVIKLNLFLTGIDEPIRAVGHLKSKGHTTDEGKFRYEVGFDKLAPGDEGRIKEWLASL